MAFLPYETSMGGGTSGGGIRVYLEEVTLSSGTLEVDTPFNTVYAVFVTEKAASAVADGVSWTATGGKITLNSTDGTSTEKYSVLAIGI